MRVDPRPDQKVDWSIYYYGLYEAGTLDFLRKVLDTGDVFLDVGANIGLMSLAASNWVGTAGQVHAFEPVPSSYQILEKNIALNGLTNIMVHKVALGSSKDRRKIGEHPTDLGRSSFNKPPAGSREHEVEVITLDEFTQNRDLPPINTVKIDVEGWELEVLKGARRLLSSSDAPILIVEYNTKLPLSGGVHKDLYSYIISINDYRIFRLKRGKESISSLMAIDSPDKLPKHDNLFCLQPRHFDRVF